MTATVVDDAASVIAQVFDEAERRDPDHAHPWVALVDGNNHQIDRIEAEAGAAASRSRSWSISSTCSSTCGRRPGASSPRATPRPRTGCTTRPSRCSRAGHGSWPRPSAARPPPGAGRAARKNADTCADYLLAKAPYLDYPTALAKGWPIATGVIEGACRHIVKDRMDITGARWGLDGAEAVLKLRALRANGGWDDYWSFHLAQERKRVHESRYLDGVLPTAA